MVLPLVKLSTLALKTLCKPMANGLKKEAYHRMSTNIQRGIYGHATNVEIRPLNKAVMVLPLSKLRMLALRSLSKPIANHLKKEAGYHPMFRRFIISIAQVNHRLSTNIQRSIYGHATNVKILPLNEAKAVQAAANLIGELFLFSVAVAALIFEVQRSARSEARKEELRKQEIQAMKQKREDLAREIEILKTRLNEMERLAKSQGLYGKLQGLSGILNFGRKFESVKSTAAVN